MPSPEPLWDPEQCRNLSCAHYHNQTSMPVGISADSTLKERTASHYEKNKMCRDTKQRGTRWNKDAIRTTVMQCQNQGHVMKINHSGLCILEILNGCFLLIGKEMGKMSLRNEEVHFDFLFWYENYLI